MRRAKPISVRVRAPSRGLVSRLPGESADQMPAQGGIVPGTSRRAATKASNVRYEDGVVCNAPGYEKVALTAALQKGLVAQWNLNEAASPRLDLSGNGHSLLETPGLNVPGGNLAIPVGSEPGKFDNAAILASVPPSACPVYTPLSIACGPLLYNGILSVESRRKLFTFRPSDTIAAVVSTLSDSHVASVDFTDAVFYTLHGFAGLGLIYAPTWDLVVAVDQRGYYTAIDPATNALVRSDDPANRAAYGGGPDDPPSWFDLAFDSDRGLVVWSAANAATVVTVPLAGMTGVYTSDDFTGLSWGNHRSSCCYNPAVRRVVFCSDVLASFPYWFFDTGTGATTQSSLSIGSFSTVWYVPEKNVIVGSVTGGHVYVIDAATDTVLATSSGTVGDLGGVVFNPCAGTGGLIQVLVQGTTLLSFDPNNAWAQASTTLPFGASAVARDKWSGALYFMGSNSSTIHKY